MTITTRVARLVAEHDTRDPFLLCRRLGLVVRRPHLVGMRGFFLWEEDVGIVNVAGGLCGMAARYVCAHELGHSQLHRGLNRVFMDRCTYMVPDYYENEADRFAAQLLFSEPPLFQDFSLDTPAMAEILNVPAGQVNARLIELEIYHSVDHPVATG